MADTCLWCEEPVVGRRPGTLWCCEAHRVEAFRWRKASKEFAHNVRKMKRRGRPNYLGRPAVRKGDTYGAGK